MREEEKEGVLLPLCIYQWVVPHHSLQALVDQEVVDEDVGKALCHVHTCTFHHILWHIDRSIDG